MKIGDIHSYNILTNKVMLHLVHSAVYVKYFSGKLLFSHVHTYNPTDTLTH